MSGPPAPGGERDGGALTHFDAAGRAAMVDVSAKAETVREATARGRITMRPETLALIAEGRAGKVALVP